MSAAIDRLRQIAAAWHRAVHVDSSMIPVHICDLDAVLADVSAERTRASAAEAECAQLTTERDAARRAATFAEMERDTLRGLSDALRADNVRLRAIVEGRTVPPTIKEARAHCHGAPDARGAFVATRLDWGAHGGARVATGLQPLPGAPHRWIALDATGRPCPWPTALDAGEGR